MGLGLGLGLGLVHQASVSTFVILTTRLTSDKKGVCFFVVVALFCFLFLSFAFLASCAVCIFGFCFLLGHIVV